MSIKVYFNQEIRRIPLETTTSFQELVSKISAFLNTKTLFETHILKYLDTDEEWVTFASEEEWKEALKPFHPRSGLKIQVISKDAKEHRRCHRERRKECSGNPLESLISQGKECLQQFLSKQPGQTGNPLDFLSQFVPPQQSSNYMDILDQALGSGEKEVIHQNVVCDGCNVTPIVGKRFKCTECKDFDFCEKCHSTQKHPHTLKAIERPHGCRFSDFWKQFAEKPVEKPVEKQEKPVEKQPEELFEEVEKPVVKQEKKVEQVDEYAEKITLLQSMGFEDVAATRNLLKKHGGNVQRVVGELLK